MTEYRTATGELKAQTIKALQWYAIQEGLKFQLSTPPIYTFTTRDGVEVKVHVEDILIAYREFRDRTHGRKARA